MPLRFASLDGFLQQIALLSDTDSLRGDEGLEEGPSLALGDDVVHAAFGEGVVTGVEPGGIVVVRFAGDRTERKLVSAYAPLEKR